MGTLFVTLTAVGRQLKRAGYRLAVFLSWCNTNFAKSEALYKDRFALEHEVADLTTDSLPAKSLLVGINHFSRLLHVRATPKRRELCNILIEAPTGGGKGLLAVSQLLTWGSSAIVFDLKGDLYTQTAGYRKTLGPVYLFDTRGFGDPYDPLQGKTSEDELYTLARHLMHEPHEGDGKAFTQRGTKMLTLLWLACLALNRQTGAHTRLLPFVGYMADLGLNSVAAIIHSISPTIARRFLDGEYNPEHDYNENKYLSSSWESLTARLYPLLTERILRCLNGSAFTARDIIGGRKSVTVYLCVPEKDLHAKAPVIRLVLESLMAEMKDYFDDAPGETAAEKGCREVLYLLDEAGNVELPSLPNDVATVRSRGISIWAAYQDYSQIESQYRIKAKAILNNMDTKLFYRQSSFETAKYIAESLGYRSDFAHSQTLRHGQEASESLSEHAVHLLTPRDIMELAPDEILVLHSNRKPMQAKRMDWRAFPILKQRRGLPPPKFTPLPHVKNDISSILAQSTEIEQEGYIDPDMKN